MKTRSAHRYAGAVAFALLVLGFAAGCSDAGDTNDPATIEGVGVFKNA